MDSSGGVLAYLSRYTQRVAISNSRLIFADPSGVTFKYKDYRPDRYKTKTVEPAEFIREFLMHVLPKDSTASVTMACSQIAASPAPSSAVTLLIASARKERMRSTSADLFADVAALVLRIAIRELAGRRESHRASSSSSALAFLSWPSVNQP